MFAEMDHIARRTDESSAGSAGAIDLATWTLWFHDNIATAHLPTPPFNEMREIMNFAAESLDAILGVLDEQFEAAGGSAGGSAGGDGVQTISKTAFVDALMESTAPLDASDARQPYDDWDQERIAGVVYDIAVQYAPPGSSALGAEEAHACVSLLCHPSDTPLAVDIVWGFIDTAEAGVVPLDEMLAWRPLKAMLRLKRNGDTVSTDAFLERELARVFARARPDADPAPRRVVRREEFRDVWLHLVAREEPALPGQPAPQHLRMRAIVGLGIGAFEQIESELVEVTDGADTIGEAGFVRAVLEAAQEKGVEDAAWPKAHLVEYMFRRAIQPGHSRIDSTSALCALGIICHPDEGALVAEAIFTRVRAPPGVGGAP
jgi:hypothetical protein